MKKKVQQEKEGGGGGESAVNHDVCTAYSVY